MARAEQGYCLWLLSLGWLEQLQKLFIFSLVYRNRDLGEKYTSSASLIRYPN